MTMNGLIPLPPPWRGRTGEGKAQGTEARTGTRDAGAERFEKDGVHVFMTRGP
jgi:hypothetical protein